MNCSSDFNRRVTRRNWLTNVSTGIIGLASRALLSNTPSVKADGKGATPAGGAHLGINLAPVRYWGSERPFQNLFLVSSPHVPLRRGGKWNQGGPLHLNEHGWVEKYQRNQHSAFIIDLGRGLPSGRYRISFKGATNAIRIQGSRDNRTFFKTDARQRLLVHVYSPIRDVVVREAQREIDGTFAQPFVDRCAQFRVLRFMDWAGTNDDRAIDWHERVTPEYYTQAGEEVALEYMVELCNAAQCGIWYCVHHRARDHYVRQVAKFFQAHLDKRLPIYVEHSNEVWNGMFPQHAYCRKQTQRPLDYHLRRTREIADLFRQVGVEINAVLGLQSAATWAAEQVLQRGNTEGIDATAIAPYFGGKVGRMPDLVERAMRGGTKAVVQMCHESIKQRRVEIEKHREIANRAGLSLLAYEGGQHLVAVGRHRRNQALVELLVRANRDPAMYDLYREYLQMWNQTTDNSLMCHYYSVGEYSKSGCWGMQEFDGQPLSETPKYRALLDCLAESARP